jgi:putative hydrolase of the HAD superfamily
VTGDPEQPVGARQRHSPPLTLSGPVDAVLFDYGLTLVRFERPVEAIEAAQGAIATRIADAGHPRPDVALLRSAVHDRVEAEVAAHEDSGALDEVDVAALEERAFIDIGLHLEPALRDQCSMLAQEAWWHGVSLYPDAVPALRALHDGGLRIGVCSNAAYRPASMHGQLAHIGLDSLIDAAVFSGEAGWRKPARQIFEAALSALGARADTTVFVGDRLREDIHGAARARMRTVLIDRDGSQPQLLSAVDQPDVVIGTLSELPALLLDVKRM